MDYVLLRKELLLVYFDGQDDSDKSFANDLKAIAKKWPQGRDVGDV